MKKSIKLIAILVILTLLFIHTSTFAAVYVGGEEEEEYVIRPYIYLTDGDWENVDNIYSSSDTKSDVEGATYNESTNTLTIENVTSTKELSIMNPGTDFTLCVEGVNNLAGLTAYSMGGDDGQEIVGVFLTGTGTLTIDTEEDSAITLFSYFGGSTLRVGKDVTLDLKSKKDVITVSLVTEKSGPTNRIQFEDETANVPVANEIYKATITKSIEAYYPSSYSSETDWLGERVIKASDPEEIYTASQWWRDEDNNGSYETEGYTIKKWIYAPSVGYYFNDESFESNTPWGDGYEMTPEEFATAGYTYVLDGEEQHAWLANPTSLNWGSSEDVAKDTNGKEYAIIHDMEYDELSGEWVRVNYAYDIVKEITELPGCYFLTKNETVSPEDLEEVKEERVWDNVYNYAVKGTTFKYGDGNVHVHDYKKVLTSKATLAKDGEIVEKCDCGHIKSKTTIARPTKFTLSKTSYTYNGKVQKPTIAVKDSNGKTIAASNYTVSYSNKDSKKVGTYKIKIAFKGNYSGSKEFAYTINPKGTSLSKVTAGKKAFTAKWNKQATETTGYEVQYSTDKNFKKGNKTATITKNKTTSTTVKKLTAKKKYYVRIRTYKTVSGKKYYSGWSSSKNVTTKK